MKFSNQDGEVESFLSIEIEKLYKILEKIFKTKLCNSIN